MKKYLLSVSALVLAFGLSSFTSKKFGTQFIYIGTDFQPISVEYPGNWIQGTKFCPNIDIHACEITVDPSVVRIDGSLDPATVIVSGGTSMDAFVVTGGDVVAHNNGF